jgi:hypothetical protein
VLLAKKPKESEQKYGPIISNSIGQLGPGSIARKNLATGEEEWFDQKTGKPWAGNVAPADTTSKVTPVQGDW